MAAPSSPPRRFMLDTNVFDLVVSERLVDALNGLQEDGICELLVCYVQQDELARIPDAAKRTEIDRLRVQEVEPGAAMWGAPWGFQWGADGARGVTIDSMQGNAREDRHGNDMQIAATAAFHDAVLVTCERRGLASRFRATGTDVPLWSGDEFVRWVREQVAADPLA